MHKEFKSVHILINFGFIQFSFDKQENMYVATPVKIVSKIKFINVLL